MQTITLYRPIGPKELTLIEASAWREFPLRLAGQPLFYPVLTEAYAIQIACDWNVKFDGAGYVTRFHVVADFVQRYPVHTVGDIIHQELWVPADELAAFNRHIVGVIEIIHTFQAGH